MDSTNLKALYGIILVALAKRDFEKAIEEIEIFNELQDTMGILLCLKIREISRVGICKRSSLKRKNSK